MARRLYLLLAATALFAAGDAWDKVRDLKSGTDIRIVRRGIAQPLEAKFDELRDDAVVVVVKNEQRAIPKDLIDRLDYRPKSGGKTVETKTASTDPDPTPPVGMNHGPNVPGQTVTSSMSLNKPGYETIYRRNTPHSMTAAPPKDAPPDKK